MQRSAVRRWALLLEFLCLWKHVCGTVAGMASCGTAGGSTLRSPSRRRWMGKWKTFGVLYRGLFDPASSMVLLMAANALLTV